MRKIIFQNMITLDGFFEGPNREIDWHVVDDEFNQYAINFCRSLDGLIFGRVTYEGMASYWPTPEARRDDPIVTELMNRLPKVVFSRTLEKAGWENSRLVKGDAVQEINRLKQQPGKDLAIFGSANLATTLVQDNLIDEYRIFVNPVVLGAGTPLFQGVKDRLKLKLVSSKTFQSGLVLLIYQPEN